MLHTLVHSASQNNGETFKSVVFNSVPMTHFKKRSEQLKCCDGRHPAAIADSDTMPRKPWFIYGNLQFTL